MRFYHTITRFNDLRTLCSNVIKDANIAITETVILSTKNQASPIYVNHRPISHLTIPSGILIDTFIAPLRWRRVSRDERHHRHWINLRSPWVMDDFGPLVSTGFQR
ncbi:hypothetical protein X798_03868 [Onchocerca flexuosa]|uniref:Uncharacterized protein n=1 Tax=Onchocerca flexuosa TaxID=387005 RepID=A0A238BUU6_9BILA|nr:hypothetical protein X798_03868 [Onchocerca flexuosa]